MIHAVKDIGEYIQQKEDSSFLSQVIQNPNSNNKYDYVLIIVFKKENDDILFKKIEIQEFTEEKLNKYAYVEGPPRGNDLTPTSRVTDIDKTYNRIKRSLNKLVNNFENETKVKEEKKLYEINKLFKDEKIDNEIFNKLKEKYDNNSILTIALEENNRLKYVGDFDKIIESLIERYKKTFYFKKSYKKREEKSIGKKNICYLCSKKKDETYGYVNTFGFYTLDKPGFKTGGFNRSEAWKNYPVCFDCATKLDLGKKYLEKNLNINFSGINYYIIPKTIFPSNFDKDHQEMFEILEDLEENKKMSLNDKKAKALISAQDEISYKMTKFNNYINFNLIFYEKIQSSFRILLYIEDVLPSYFKKIFKIKDEIDQNELFIDLKGKEELFSLKFNFGVISNFFYVREKAKEDFTDFTKEFLEILNSIFSKTKISYRFLINRFTEHIQYKFINNKSFWLDTLKAIQILMFMKKLDLLKNNRIKNEEDFMPTANSDYKKNVIDFLMKHEEILDNNSKKTVFLEGVWVQRLLNYQKSNKNGSQPFLGRLNGLKLNKKIFKRIFSETKNKFIEYDENNYQNRQLEELITDYFLESNLDDLSNNEISFYFALGMAQANKFYDLKEGGIK